MEKNKLDKFLFILTITAAAGFVLSFLFQDSIHEWLLGLSVLGILIRADIIILETRIPIFLKIIIPVALVCLLFIFMLTDISEGIFLIGNSIAYIFMPLLFVHIPLIFIFAKKEGQLKETSIQLAAVVAIIIVVMISLNYLGADLNYF